MKTLKTYSNIIIHYQSDFKDNPFKKASFSPFVEILTRKGRKNLGDIFMIKNDKFSKIAAIICEYNPFHNGHAYHIAQTRALGATHVVGIMSGNFVQRGEPAMFSKWARTRCALLGGVDLGNRTAPCRGACLLRNFLPEAALPLQKDWGYALSQSGLC